MGALLDGQVAGAFNPGLQYQLFSFVENDPACAKATYRWSGLFGSGRAMMAENLAGAEALERSQSNRAALSATVNNAVTASIANQPANTARSYAKAQRLWREFCADRQFDDGVLISEEKLVLWLQEVVL
ncbi:uncharacterized protein NFIA_112500 [Aspergillus fischeri NRRL 181]|uniref:Uncharacterized protein n=1 Tax=Neosartorya fischeri (strain ATCC 1020 / DSM 3700 / CBS 544.65 / FGSC A1164 / JCM 1740 / NRRL 181 / WB 181) TaxID=331117 RepID=A1D8L5_NEOFI|nr:uncharacterized protein NFIA_112500 [Aspergillus fischeri NRRL 181]EAW20726.1 hypothetical protein NFIA_112500 [Aspergillus fischeri NRRL 181]KAG2001014.1 hypothetical protein GB937_010593 [Aspergillus fischeri]